MNENTKCYLFYDFIWGEFGQGVEGKELKGVILAQNESNAVWAAKLIKLEYDKIESVNPADNDSTIFKIDD